MVRDITNRSATETATSAAKLESTWILEGVPAILSTLETLIEIHTFLKPAYLRFELIYQQEVQRHDHDEKRATLFGTIKNVISMLLELREFGEYGTRMAPNGYAVLGRLASICQDIREDIEACYNVLDTYERRSPGIKVLKASSWNTELASHAARFTFWRVEVAFALSMQTITAEEIDSNMRIMVEIFLTVLSPPERDMKDWISYNGVGEAVLESHWKCAAMLRYEALLAIQPRRSWAQETRVHPEICHNDQV
ncbi:hypothetical protein B0H14DRAFT_55627 [Mycena olivaceomarginata]|nr:hypothetical protein B0H14DRAFT_55627 [Mycena olivaceomarginata]